MKYIDPKMTKEWGIRMLRDTVLIEPETVPKLSDIIVLPDDTEVLPPAIGNVLAVGPGVREISVGDRVHFERFDWSIAVGEQIILRECEILAKEVS